MNNVPSFFLPSPLPSLSFSPLPLFSLHFLLSSFSFSLSFSLPIFLSPFSSSPSFLLFLSLLLPLPFTPSSISNTWHFLELERYSRKKAKCPRPGPLPAPLQAGSQEQLCGSQEQLGARVHQESDLGVESYHPTRTACWLHWGDTYAVAQGH